MQMALPRAGAAPSLLASLRGSLKADAAKTLPLPLRAAPPQAPVFTASRRAPPFGPAQLSGTAVAQRPQSVFNGAATFTGMRPAYRAAFDEIYPRMQNDGGDREYGFELVPGDDGTVALGRLVRGGAHAVQATLSDEPLVRRLLSRADTVMPLGHSHPQMPVRTAGFSPPDLSSLTRSRPLGGIHSSGLLDYTTGRMYQVTLDARVQVPAAVSRGITGEGDAADGNAAVQWVGEQIETGKLRVNDLGRASAAPQTPAPTAFYFQIPGEGVGSTLVFATPNPVD
jgi:hypothetical protein